MDYQKKYMNNKMCFVDTSCWIALLNKDDNLHKGTDTLYKNLMSKGINFITTSEILTETANALSSPGLKPSVISFFQLLQYSSRIEIIFINIDFWYKGWSIYENRLDKSWSLTDCISFVVMHERGIYDALTSDNHFIQAGFNALLVN